VLKQINKKRQKQGQLTFLRLGFVVFILYAALNPVVAEADDPPFFSFAVGSFDLVLDHNKATEFRAEYRSDKKIWIFKPFGGVMATSDSSFYGFGGVLLDLYFGRRIVFTPSFAGGYYERGDGKDLGHEIEFRSGAELAYRFDDRSRLGLSFYHLSNASIDTKNPGTEVLSIVYSVPIGQTD
tara:strand:+ start:817 stop:1362 length:546 start_codon:yes stop_codon:yes gene_type:complete